MTARHAWAAGILIGHPRAHCVRRLAAGSEGGPRRTAAHPGALSCADAGRPHADHRHAGGPAPGLAARPARGQHAAAAGHRPARRGRDRQRLRQRHRLQPAGRPGGLSRRLSVGGRTELVLEPHRPGAGRQRRRGARALARPAGGCRLRRPRPGVRHRCVERRRDDGAAGLRSLRAPRRRGIGRRRLPLAAGLQARAPAAGPRDPRHRGPGRPLRRQAPRLQRRREAVAVAVAAHRRLPGQCRPAERPRPA